MQLPRVADVEPGDTWTFGLPSDPTKTRWYRAVAREVAVELERGAVDVTAADFQAFYTTLLKIPEHTWGYTGAGCSTDWSNAAWHLKTSQHCEISLFYEVS